MWSLVTFSPSDSYGDDISFISFGVNWPFKYLLHVVTQELPVDILRSISVECFMAVHGQHWPTEQQLQPDTACILQVNGEMIHPPLTPRQGLSVTLSSRSVQLATDFGLTVRFDGNYQAGEKERVHRERTLRETQHTRLNTVLTLSYLTGAIKMHLHCL